MEQNREHLKSRLGFILLSAGCAIGCGNVWRFPWQVANYGGGLFVLLYLACLLVLGIPIMICEFSVGRAAQASPVKMYKLLEKPNQKWHLHGYAALFGNIALMAFYTVVTGYIINYFTKFLSGNISTEIIKAGAAGDLYGATVTNKGQSLLFLGVTVVIAFTVLAFNIQKVLEKVTKILMVGLFILISGLAIYAAFLPNAGDGYSFYLLPRFDSGEDFFSILAGAMQQALFTLSLGIGSMAIFGSYIDKNRSLFGESITIVALDTFVAIVAGLVMFPAIASVDGLENIGSSGSGFLFVSMTTVFNTMGVAGRWIGSIFFLFMIFAALSTVLAVCENIIACIKEITGWSRPLTSIICGIGIFICAIPTACNPNWIDVWDFVVSNNLLPLGSLVIVLFCSYKLGWGWDNFLTEANAGKGLKVKHWMKYLFKYVVPIILIALYIYGLFTFENYASFANLKFW